MTFVLSTDPDITEAIPAAFSQRLQANIASMQNIRFDCTIGGLGFCIDPDGNAYTLRGSYIRQSVAVQKQQTDNSKEPGEQSLDGFWIRSQNSWHHGAGINFYEPGSEPDTEFRFTESSGMNVWTPGSLTALHRTTLAKAAAGTSYVVDAGNGYLAYLDSGTASAPIGWGTLGSYALNTPPAGCNGRFYFYGFKKYIKVGWVSPASATVGIWNGGTNTLIAKNATVEPQVWYLKDRLIVTQGKDLFEVPLNSATPVDLSVTTGNLYSPTDANTTWVDATEGPSAIYLACTDGTKDTIVRFSLQNASSGQTPVLSQAYQVLALPNGERITKMFGYLGRYLVLSTSLGIRVCAVDSSGNLTMGQVMVSTTDNLTAFAARGNFVYVGGASVPMTGTTGSSNLAGWGTASGCIRINLGEPIGSPSDLVFAYATDLRADVTGTVTSMAFNTDGTLEFAVTGSGVWRESNLPVTGGYMAMGRVRYDTLVPKVFHSLDMSGQMGIDSTFTVSLHDELENPFYSTTMDSTTGIFNHLQLDLSLPRLYIRPVGVFTTSTTMPNFQLLQLRAMPAPARIRQIRLPLRCYDSEQDASGNTFGYDGYAFDRMSALEHMEETGVPVVVQDSRTGETFTGTIDEIQYHNVVSPDRYNSNFSGHATVTFTKLTPS